MKQISLIALISILYYAADAQQYISNRSFRSSTVQKFVRQTKVSKVENEFKKTITTKNMKNGDSTITIRNEKSDTLLVGTVQSDTISIRKDRFGITGIGNLNSENVQKLNGSAKISCYFVPVQSKRLQTILIFSFNKNASNDSILSSTLLFPESGNSSFIGTLDQSWTFDNPFNYRNTVAILAEFSLKNISTTVNKSDIHFDILNYTLGLRYTFDYKFNSIENDKEEEKFASLSIIPYFNICNIPNEDVEDYKLAFIKNQNENLPDELYSWGIKVMVQYQQLGVFADFKQMMNSIDIQNRDIKGFNSNIGIAISTDIFKF